MGSFLKPSSGDGSSVRRFRSRLFAVPPFRVYLDRSQSKRGLAGSLYLKAAPIGLRVRKRTAPLLLLKYPLSQQKFVGSIYFCQLDVPQVAAASKAVSPAAADLRMSSAGRIDSQKAAGESAGAVR